MAKRVRASGAQPFSVRLTANEKAILEAKAGRRPLGVFMRERLLGEAGVPRKTSRRTPRASDKALAQLLAALGASEVGGNLAQIIQFAETGVLPIDDSMAVQLREACAAVLEMRGLLLHALGRGLPASPSIDARPEPLSSTFARATDKPGDRQ